MANFIKVSRTDGNKTTIIQTQGALGILSLKIQLRSSPRQRRAIAISFFRQIRPWLVYFKNTSLSFDEDASDFQKKEPLSKQARFGFNIRTQGLEKGWTQKDFELGRFHPKKSTRRKLKEALAQQ